MRLLFLTETIPYPLDSGGRIKTYYTLRALSSEHEVHCHAFIRDEGQRRFQADLKPICRSVTLHARPASLWREGSSLTLGYATGTPFLVRRHFDPRAAAAFMALCSRERFDAVYCDHLSMLEYGRRLGLPIVLDAHNVEFEIVRRHATTLGLSPLRAFAELEWRLLRRYERSLYPLCRLILSVSDVDLRALRLLAGDDVTIAVVPIPVSVNELVPVANLTHRAELLYVGGQHWPPNADAVRFFVTEILPLVRQRVPSAHLTVVGRFGAGRPIASPGVTFVGHVDDIGPYFEQSRVMVVPLRSGSGMRVKILDALARGIPTVTTRIGFEGIAAIPGTHLLVADDPQAFSAQVVRLLTDDGLATSLSAKGRSLALAQYDESVVSKKTLEAISARRLCSTPRMSSLM